MAAVFLSAHWLWATGFSQPSASVLSDEVCLLFLVCMETRTHAWLPLVRLLDVWVDQELRVCVKALWFLRHCWNHLAEIFFFCSIFFRSWYWVAFEHLIIEQVAFLQWFLPDFLPKSRCEFRRYIHCLLFINWQTQFFVGSFKVNDTLPTPNLIPDVGVTNTCSGGNVTFLCF